MCNEILLILYSKASLNAPLVSGDVWNYFRENYEGDVTENALLSKYWDPNINHWMRVFAPAGTDGYVDLLCFRQRGRYEKRDYR